MALISISQIINNVRALKSTFIMYVFSEKYVYSSAHNFLLFESECKTLKYYHRCYLCSGMIPGNTKWPQAVLGIQMGFATWKGGMFT